MGARGACERCDIYALALSFGAPFSGVRVSRAAYTSSAHCAAHYARGSDDGWADEKSMEIALPPQTTATVVSNGRQSGLIVRDLSFMLIRRGCNYGLRSTGVIGGRAFLFFLPRGVVG